MEQHLWIARDQRGDLYLYGARPLRTRYGFVDVEHNEQFVEINKHLYPEVTYATSPKELTIK